MEKVRLGDVCTVRGGYAFKSELFKNEGIPIIRIGNITKDGLVVDEDICYNEAFWDENLSCERVSDAVDRTAETRERRLCESACGVHHKR